MHTALPAREHRDPLTGLVGRQCLHERLQTELAHSALSRKAIALIVLDIDRFGDINAALGYRIGDLTLRHIALHLATEVGPKCLVARLDGNTFAILIPDLASHNVASQAKALAGRLCHSLDQMVQIEGHTIDTPASIGLATSPCDASDADALLQFAEAAMLRAKRMREGPLAHDPTANENTQPNASRLGELRRAVAEGELVIHLQPQRSLSQQRVTGAEALLRWQHPQKGLVPPRDFIPFAERTGFIRTLTLWTLDAAARAWKAVAAPGEDFVISVNLSAHDLHDTDLAHKFANVLRRHDLPARAFCLEITEGAVMEEPTQALQTLRALRALGFRLSIDDFGTGHSALSYLRRLPVDELKIDQSFVFGMAHDERDARIVQSTIELAHALGLRVVAEGVESAQALERLLQFHCDLAQGIHISEPLTVPGFAVMRALAA